MSILKKIADYIFNVDEDLSIENRIFFSALVVGILTSAFGTIANLIFFTSSIAVIIPLFLTIILLIPYYLVRIQRIIEPIKLPIILLAQIGISIIWIYNGGINSSNIMPGFVIFILSMVIVSNKKKIYILLLFLTLYVSVYFIQLYKPELVINYISETDRWVDSIIKLIYSSSFIYLIIKYLHKNYALEKQKSEDNENKYRKSEANLIEAQRIAKIGSWEWDMHTNVMLWSKQMYRVFNMKADEFDGNPESIMHMIHPDDVIRFIRNLYIKLTNGISSSLEFRIIHQDGSTHYLFADGHIQFNLKGKPYRIIGTVQDITSFKLIEEQKRKVDNWARTLSEAVKQSQVTTVITDISGNIEFVNPKFKETTGYSIKEVIGKNPRILKSDNSITNYNKLWNTILAGKSWHGNFQNKKKDGTLYWESAIISPIKNEQGIITHFLAVKEDITNRIKAEQELLDSKERYKILSNQFEAILDHIPGLVFYKDAENNFIRVNKYMAESYQRSKKELEGLNLAKLHSTEIAEKYYQDDLSVINSGIAKLNIEEQWKTGIDLKWVNTSKIPFVDASGKINGIIGISMDITKRKLYEEQILKNNELLEKLIAEKDKFFSIISHDLRSPFASLISLLELLAENSNSFSPEELDEFAISAYSTAKSTFHLLENLLEWSRLQRGVMPFKPEKLNLKEFFANCDVSTIEMAKKKRIDLNVNFLEDAIVLADSNMLHSIMRNLVTNAIKFTKKGGWVKVNAQAYEKNAFLISVTDNGIGMNTERLNKLFQIDTTVSRPGTDGEPSSGLGLILCKEFVEKHGGKIWAESDPDSISGEKGSTFYFTIPTK